MKTTTKILSLLLTIMTLGMGLTSCGKDDEPSVNTNPAATIAGEYVGTGRIEIYGTSVVYDTYPGMKIMVTRSSNEYVIVTPLKADGTYFFNGGSDSGNVYQITQTANGGFILSSTEVPMAQLTISNTGDLAYNYPYVSIGDTSGYSLVFNGKKQ